MTVAEIDSNQEKIICKLSNIEEEANIHQMRKGRGVADRDYCGLQWIPC